MNIFLKKASDLIKESERILFLTGAGMSADSNIPTFRDKNGYWRQFPLFKEKGLAAEDLASPWAFRTTLHHAWAFYEWRRRNALENNPHEGYTVINRWMNILNADTFIHTTNTDGYHLRSRTDPKRIKEVHGSMWRLQCLTPCSNQFWEESHVPLCDLDYKTMSASSFPECRMCSSIARPHILMFSDFDYVGYPQQEESFNNFMAQKIDLVILTGSSGTIPTNDHIALSLKQYNARIININPDITADRIVNADIFLKMGSKEAFIALDKLLW